MVNLESCVGGWMGGVGGGERETGECDLHARMVIKKDNSSSELRLKHVWRYFLYEYKMTALVSNKLAVDMTWHKACFDPDVSARRIFCVLYNWFQCLRSVHSLNRWNWEYLKFSRLKSSNVDYAEMLNLKVGERGETEYQKVNRNFKCSLNVWMLIPRN